MKFEASNSINLKPHISINFRNPQKKHIFLKGFRQLRSLKNLWNSKFISPKIYEHEAPGRKKLDLNAPEALGVETHKT